MVALFDSTDHDVTYHLSVPWHELEQLRVAAFQPIRALSRFFTPLLWVAGLKEVVL